METYIFDKKAPTLEEAQKLVGGYVERVKCPNGVYILCDEEGLLKGKEINLAATVCARQKIVGNVCILTGRAKAKWS